VWYVIGTNEGHGFAKKANQDYLQAVEIEFLRRSLLGPGEHQGGDLPGRFPVFGTVRVDGRSVTAGTIILHPIDPTGRRATGAIRDGHYTLTTVNPDDGALPGTYRVTIESHVDAPGIKVPARYTNAETTGLTCQIRPGANILDFDLR
jgi:hypothetical protein